MRPASRALVAGTLASATLCGLAGSLNSVPSPRLTRNPWHDYLALSAAAGVSPGIAYLTTAAMLTICFAFTGCLCMRKAARAAEKPERVPELEKEESWSPS